MSGHFHQKHLCELVEALTLSAYQKLFSSLTSFRDIVKTLQKYYFEYLNLMPKVLKSTCNFDIYLHAKNQPYHSPLEQPSTPPHPGKSKKSKQTKNKNEELDTNSK